MIFTVTQSAVLPILGDISQISSTPLKASKYNPSRITINFSKTSKAEAEGSGLVLMYNGHRISLL